MAEAAMKGSIPSGGLDGLSGLITGGGSGIGAACAARLVADGAAVTICGRTEAKLQAAANSIEANASHGGQVQWIAGDVTDEDDVRRIVARASEPTGALDLATSIVVLEAIERVNAELGTSTVVITHNADIAHMADRVIHLSGGNITGVDKNSRKREASELTW